MQSLMGEIDKNLTALIHEMTYSRSAADHTLCGLLRISADLENLSARSAFRLAAAEAYEIIVVQCMKVRCDQRFEGRQSTGEFMLQRFDLAMRPVKSTARYLSKMADRAMRAGQWLRTRVDVKRSVQSQSLLQSRDR